MEQAKKIIYADDLRNAIRDDLAIRGAAFSAVMKHIYAAPAVDAVEVVRCKDCDCACPGNYGIVCTAWGARTDPNMFCANGERRA